MTTKQLKFVHKLLEREGLSFAAEQYAAQFSNNRTKNLEALTHQETQALIAEFTTPSPQSKMQRKIISMAHEMRWELPNKKVDLQRLDAWCIKYTPAHTNFKSIPTEDLPLVVSIFSKMYYQFLKQL